MKILKKNILFYNGSLRMGGIERVLIDVLQNLDKDKYNIDLIIEDGIRSLNVFEKDIPNYINLYYLKSENLIRKTDSYRQKRKKNIIYRIIYQFMMTYEGYIKRKKIKEFAQKKKYDVIIDFDMGLSKFITFFKTDKKIAWVHSDIKCWYKKQNRIQRLGKRLSKYDKIVTICDAMKEKTIDLYPFLKDKLVRIYNPFNFERIKSLANERVDSKLKNFLTMEYYVSVMRLTTDSKDFHTLITAFKLAKKQGIKEKLYILGDGPDKEKIENIIKINNMENEIFLFGNMKNPYPWIKNSKGLIHSSKYEGFGLVLVEALILKKLVISSDCPIGPKEILENGTIGLLYEVGDYNTLSKLLVKNSLLEFDSDKIEKYNINKIIKEYDTLIFKE